MLWLEHANEGTYCLCCIQGDDFDPLKPEYQVVSLESNTEIERKKALLALPTAKSDIPGAPADDGGDDSGWCGS